MKRDLVVRISLPNVIAVAGLVLLIVLLGSLVHMLTIFFLAILLAVGISEPVNWLEDHRVPRGIGIGLIYLVLVAAMVALGFGVVPMVIRQVEKLVIQFPDLVREPLRQAGEWLGERVPALKEDLPTGDLASQIASKGVALLSGFGGLAFALGVTISSVLVAVIVIMTMAYFMTSRRRFASKAIWLFAPETARAELDRIVGVIGRRLGRWLWAQMLIAGFYALAFGTGLVLLDVPYAATLAILGGILELVPYVGGFIATILTMIVAFTVEPMLAVWVLLLHLVIGNIEVHVIAPRLMGRAVETHPVLTILALFAGAELLGIMGAIIAIPLMVVIQAVVEELYLRPRGRLDEPDAPIGQSDAEAGGAPQPVPVRPLQRPASRRLKPAPTRRARLTTRASGHRSGHR